MKASKFTDAQKAFVIKQGEEGTPVAEVCRKAGISQATYFNWKKKYAGLLPTEMRRLRELEERSAPTRADAHDRSRIPPAPSAQAGQRGEKSLGPSAETEPAGN
ncbi:insertion sequence transposase protein [Novosphingobium sp. PP1Y]|nr:insertion sequence transposase protein [Novosphingobium sp. PP1Y]